MDVELLIEASVATVRLNRPESLNALSAESLRLLCDYADEIEANPAIRAVVLCGQGRSFCAGADIKGSGATSAPPVMSVSYARKGMFTWQQTLLKFHNLNKPVVCAVRGHAVGIGWSLAMTSDQIIASETALFCANFLNRATVPEGGLVHVLAKNIGQLRAKEVVFSRRRVSADEASMLGLVNKVVPDDELEDQAQILARELAALPTFSVGLTKQLFRANCGSIEEFLGLELNAVALAVNSQDATEGRAAAREKRSPDFKGL
ncbi:enoyl-CoA hydratase/isomerase family protein [Pseudomonas sp. BF-R-19]|uniref:enoyl-CoA hydratase/isomerase family protein n=1 Tax=Pseudomonas sp. BF-R-19 TaxID=2832397 RepID=UPI001CBB7BC9|nr:enoyl-CoA hydratase/isomerase family protein [Pseudomonas sp. BF-R-19]